MVEKRLSKFGPHETRDCTRYYIVKGSPELVGRPGQSSKAAAAMCSSHSRICCHKVSPNLCLLGSTLCTGPHWLVTKSLSDRNAVAKLENLRIYTNEVMTDFLAASACFQGNLSRVIRLHSVANSASLSSNLQCL